MMESRENDNKPARFIRDGEFLDSLKDYRRQKEQDCSLQLLHHRSARTRGCHVQVTSSRALVTYTNRPQLKQGRKPLYMEDKCGSVPYTYSECAALLSRLLCIFIQCGHTRLRHWHTHQNKFGALTITTERK